jgi:hypothetical protein
MRFSETFALMQLLMHKQEFLKEILSNAELFTVCRFSNFKDLDKSLVENLKK